MMLFSGSRTFVFSALNVKNLNAFMYTLCSYVLKQNKRKHLLFMTFLKSPDSLTHPVYNTIQFCVEACTAPTHLQMKWGLTSMVWNINFRGISVNTVSVLGLQLMWFVS